MVTEPSSGRPTMWRAVVRWWRYLGAKAEDAHDERADPKIQLTQALGEARANHARLTERAAIVVAHQKHLQRQLERLAAEHERADGSGGTPARRGVGAAAGVEPAQLVVVPLGRALAAHDVPRRRG